MIRADEIGKTVEAYLARYPDEVGRLAPLIAALAQPADITLRRTFTGHVTCSAIVLDAARRILHIRHNALNIWLCPGGHLEADDTNLVGAAVREVEEETGIAADRLTLVDDIPLDIDVHPIPANPVKNEPDHRHFDLRYAFTAIGTLAVALQAEEVHDFAWLPATQLEPAAVRHKLMAMA